MIGAGQGFFSNLEKRGGDPPQCGDKRRDVVGLLQIVGRAVFHQADGLIDIGRCRGKDDRRRSEEGKCVPVDLLDVSVG